jgi:hypothetical protein
MHHHPKGGCAGRELAPSRDHHPATTDRGPPSAKGHPPTIDHPATDLRDVLGDQVYESLARKGETMTTAAMATYTYDQIDQARTELERPS